MAAPDSIHALVRAVHDDPAGARRSYQEFFALWKDADADLLPLAEARREFARLPQ
jgi:hypothetical protein